MSSDVLVVVALANDSPKKTDLSAVGCGLSAAAELSGACDAVLIGGDIVGVGAASSLANLGLRCVYRLEHPDLSHYTAESASSALQQFLNERDYRLIVAASSSASRETLPRLAALIDAPMASDVLSLDSIDDHSATFTRAVFVGNLLASVELAGGLAIATCRASEFQPAEDGGGDAAAEETVVLETSPAHPGKNFVDSSHAETSGPDLAEAEIVVSVGRGVKGPDQGIPLAQELAAALGAALGASRAVVDSGWLPNELQVGQTGKIVAPDLYIAIGISGAIQHLAGMRNSKNIVAINKDRDAPIFEIADLGWVTDLFTAVPEMVEEIKKTKNS